MKNALESYKLLRRAHYSVYSPQQVIARSPALRGTTKPCPEQSEGTREIATG
jgi:hypothetical protein